MNASFHRGRDSEGLMDAREVVVHEVYRERMDSLLYAAW